MASREAPDEELLLYHTKEFIQVIEQSKNQTMEESEKVCSKYDRYYSWCARCRVDKKFREITFVYREIVI
jgi:acetoin utilization deacetylase AcuC-like enzyme